GSSNTTSATPRSRWPRCSCSRCRFRGPPALRAIRIQTMYPRPVPSAAPPRPYTVSELLAEVGTTLRTAWPDVAVVREIGRFHLPGVQGSFTLKDRPSAVSGIMFSSDLRRVPFRLEPGLEVVARGSLDLYAPQGKFQIKVFALEPVGRGALQLAFEQLKVRLE